MLEVTKRFETKIFHVGNGFWCEITLDNDSKFGPIYECYIWHDAYMTKQWMFGLPEYQECNDKHYGWDEIIEIVEANMEKYIGYYEEDFMD